jgi:hypothetical protein
VTLLRSLALAALMMSTFKVVLHWVKHVDHSFPTTQSSFQMVASDIV